MVSSEDREFISQTLFDVGGYIDLKEPVILTSGELGIYYVNTEKLLGDEGAFARYGNNAEAMIHHALAEAGINERFREIVKILAEEVEGLLPDSVQVSKVAISGGQRRDWIFSGPIADFLGYPHVALYKDGRIEDVDRILSRGSYVVHISDLLTKGSSAYDPRNDPPTGWVPTLRRADAQVDRLVTVVTRLQGGEGALAKAEVEVTAFVPIDEAFLRAYSSQPDTALAYTRNPQRWSEAYIRDEGVDPFVKAFGPDRKDDRGYNFLETYADVLRESGRFDELAARVRDEHGVGLVLPEG